MNDDQIRRWFDQRTTPVPDSIRGWGRESPWFANYDFNAGEWHYEPAERFVTRDEVSTQVERLKRKLETMNANADKDDYKNSLTPEDYSSAELDSFLSSFRKEELVNA